VTFNELISDATVIADDWDVAGVTGEAFSSTTNGDTANDADIYITFADGVLDTASTPTLSYTQDDPTDSDVEDLAGNRLADFAAAATVDQAAPVVLSWETADLNSDGFIDAIHVIFNEAILDTTFIANDWDVAGVAGEAFSSTTNGDTADDADLYITFTDGVHDTGAIPNLTYTQDDPTDADVEDLAGNLLASVASGSWWDSQWQYRTKITFTGNNPAGTENLDSFPVLVSLTASEVDFDKIKAGGADIRFVDDDDSTALEYQIESWNDGSKTATVWVNVPRIDQGSTTDNIYLYYDNPAATAASSTATWNTDYQGVWHLNEGTGVTAVDATGNTNDAAPVNNPTASTGKAGLGGALTFFSSSELSIGADASLDLSTYSDWTISAWVRPTDYTGVKWPVVYTYGDFDASLGLTVEQGTDGLIENWSNNSTLRQSNTAVTFNAWNHIAISRTGTTTTFYLNGVADGSGSSPAIGASGRATVIGGNTLDPDDQFLGLIDEVRISAGSSTSASRSAEWMSAQYSSMNLTFNTYSAEESKRIPMSDKTAPVVLTRDTADLDGDGSIDALRRTFSESI
jgi:hypothetical protein